MMPGNITKTFSIASMNCRGLANAQKRRDVFHFLRKEDYCIYCLQDVHLTKEMESVVRAEWGLNCYFSSYKSNARGVAILFNNNFEYKVNQLKFDTKGNMLAIDLVINDCEIALISIYGPNTDDPTFYDNVYIM
jgi:exonuclease III